MCKLRLALAAACLLLASCSVPLPPDKAAYAGQWQSSEMSLTIKQDGSVAYKRQNGNENTSMNGPLKSFEGNNFVVGIGPIKTTFVVSTPPHEDQGKWKMVVDGVELTRAQ
jgi:hypothetical protein